MGGAPGWGWSEHPIRCSLWAAACYLLFMLTRAALMTSSRSEGPAVVLGYLSVFSVNGPVGATALLTLAIGMGGTAHSSFWANMVDVSPRHCGVVLGASNTIGTLPGILANMWAGYALETHDSWMMVWSSAVLFYVFGFAMFYKYCQGDVVWT